MLIMQCMILVGFCQEYFTMSAKQQGALKAFMQRLIRGGVVDQWEWPTLQEKWLKDSLCPIVYLHLFLKHKNVSGVVHQLCTLELFNGMGRRMVITRPVPGWRRRSDWTKSGGAGCQGPNLESQQALVHLSPRLAVCWTGPMSICLPLTQQFLNQ